MPRGEFNNFIFILINLFEDNLFSYFNNFYLKLGHGPYSHSFDRFISKRKLQLREEKKEASIVWSHEKVSMKLL